MKQTKKWRHDLVLKLLDLKVLTLPWFFWPHFTDFEKAGTIAKGLDKHIKKDY